MSAHKTRFGSLAAALALLALPAGASAAPYVPPGNSAANQYTEAVPTAGGPKATSKGKRSKHQSPGKVLGARNAKKLNAEGPEGQAAAEVAAATAPATVQAVSPDSAGTFPPRESRQAGDRGSATAPSGGSSGEDAADRGGAPAEDPVKARGAEGSSGVGEVIGQATGSSSGQLGLLLPLLIVAVVIWSLAYLLRQRRGQAA